MKIEILDPDWNLLRSLPDPAFGDIPVTVWISGEKTAGRVKALHAICHGDASKLVIETEDVRLDDK